VTAPWWAAFGPAESRVTCEGHRHLIRWADGRLTAASHPDAEGELVMAALGGETARCLEIVQAWGARDDDLEVLAIGPRSAADEVRAVMPGDDAEPVLPPWVLRQSAARYGLWSSRSRPALFTSTVRARRRRMRAGGVGITHAVVGSRPMISASLTASHRRTATYSSGRSFAFGRGSRWATPAQERAEARLSELRMLFALGPELQWRLSGAVAAAWSDGRPGHNRAAARPALTAALAGRLAPAAQAWLGTDPDRVEVTVHDGPGWGELAATGTGDQPGLTAALAPGWLARVWAPGLALVAGRLVVAVPEAHWPRARVLALTAPGTEPAPMDVQWEAGQWRPVPG
jgi:hypothetical protein